MLENKFYQMPTMKNIVNAQYAIAHAMYHYWKGYMEGFMDEYRESVKEFNEDYAMMVSHSQVLNEKPKKAKAKKHG